jgi:hypothetical protein
MNAARLKLFEDVRAAVSGRIRDEGEIRELAQRVCDESVDLRKRIDRAVSYARDGLRLEACAEAEAEPSVFEMAQAFDAEHMRNWRAWCSKQRLPVPDQVSQESLGEVEEAIQQTAPLRNKLAKLRRLVLSDADAWDRLEVLRILIARDPDNPAWQQDRDAMEPVAAKELVQRAESRSSKGDLEAAEGCVARLEDGKWAWGGIARAAAQARAALHRAAASRLAVEARELVTRLNAEWSAQDEAGVRGTLERWDAMSARMESCGGTMPAEPSSRVALAREWLDGRDAEQGALREHDDAVEALRRLLDDPSSAPAALRAAVRAAEGTVGGVPDELRAGADRALAEHDRRARVRRMSVAAVAAVALLALAVGAVLLSVRSQRERRAEDAIAAIAADLASGRLADAEAKSGAAEADAELSRHPGVAAAVADVRTAREQETRRADRVREQIAQLRKFKPESIVERAPSVLEDCRTDAEGQEVGRIVEAAKRELAEQRDRRTKEGLAAVEEVKREVEAAPTAGTAQFAEWEGRLATIEQRHDGLFQVQDAARAVRVAIDARRSSADAQAVGLQRSQSLDALGSAAGSAESLVAALKRFAASHPDAPEVKDIERALESARGWSALAEWAAERDRPTAELAAAPQPRRAAAAAAAERHLSAHPQGPYAADCAAILPLLDKAPEWRRAYLPQKLDGDDWKLYALRFRDGTRWYLTANPASVVWSADGGSSSKSVLIVKGHAKAPPPPREEPSTEPFRAAFESDKEMRQVRRDQLVDRGEGPSPERELAERLRKRLEELERFDDEPNDVSSFLDTVGAIASSDMDPINKALVLKGLIAAAAEEMPQPVRDDVSSAIRPIEKLGIDGAPGSPSFVEWLDPDDPKAREKRKESKAALERIIKVPAWKDAYAKAIGGIASRLAVAYEPAGVLVPGQGGVRFAPGPGKPPAVDVPLLALDATKAGERATMVQVGVLRKAGDAALAPAASGFPVGTLLFRAVPAGGKAP